MAKKQIFSGFIIGVLSPLFIVLIFSLVIGQGAAGYGLNQLIMQEQVGNTIRIGVLTNCAIFTIAITKGRDKMAQGLVVSTLLCLIYTLI